MSKFKTIGILAVLIFLTCCFVFAPNLISNQDENAFIRNKIHWSYTPNNHEDISSMQVISLYQSRHFDCDFIYSIDESDNKAIVLEEVAELFDSVFESNAYLIEYMNNILSNGDLSYFKKNVLIAIDNHPVALRLVKVIVATPNGSLELIFEIKTKTLLSLSYYLSSGLTNYKTETESFTNDLSLALSDYCKNKLDLREGEYHVEYTLYDQNENVITFIIIPEMEIEKNMQVRYKNI